MQLATQTSVESLPPGTVKDADVLQRDPRYSQYKVIRRNGAVVGFEPSKITVAMSKAFIAVNGGTGAASARVRELVAGLTEQAVAALLRHQPSGLGVPGLHRGLDRRLVGDLAHLRSGLAQPAAHGCLAGLHVQDREAREHDVVAAQHRVGAVLRRADVEQPGHRGVLPAGCPRRADGPGPSGRGDELDHGSSIRASRTSVRWFARFTRRASP